MAWSGLMFKLPADAKLEDLPNDYQLPLIGSSEEVYIQLTRLFPKSKHKLGQTDYCDETSYLELRYDKDSMVDSISVRSNAGPTAMLAMRAVCEGMGLTLFDNQSGKAADFGTETQEGMNKYREWISRVMSAES